MFIHNLKLFFRNIKKYPGTFLINLIGLSTGLASVLMIYLWVSDEINIDKFHKNDEQLYQLMINLNTPDGISTMDFGPSLLAADLKEKLPEIENTTHASASFMRPVGIIKDQTNTFPVNGLFTNNTFFDVFSYPLLVGDPTKLLLDQSSIVISRNLATSLFQSPDQALGKAIHYTTQYFDTTFFVTGVFEDIPNNSTSQFEVLVSFENWIIETDPDVAEWSDGYAETYFTLYDGVDKALFEQKISSYLRDRHEFWMPSTLFMRKYSDRYLKGNYKNGLQLGGRITYVRQFSILALFILLIACINFMNLSTAQASKRLKEIGIEKAIGGSRKMLIARFLMESMIIVILSFIAALGLVVFTLPWFNELTLKSLEISYILQNIWVLMAFLILTACLAGSYPAFYLSSFRPQAILKDIFPTQLNGKFLRKALVIFQFALAVIFIAGVLVIHNQMEYTQTKNLGYNRDNIISFFRPPTQNGPTAFLAEIRKIPGVLSASNMSGSILSGSSIQNGYSWRGDDADEDISFQAPMIGYGTIELLDMEIVQGRAFSRDFNDNAEKIILNESALKMMQLENPIGMKIRKNVYQAFEEREIIGVVKDFHYGSLHHEVKPLILRFRNGGLNNLVKIKAGSEVSTINQIEQLFKEFYPDRPFDFSFLDTAYQNLYKAETRVAVLSKYFGGLAIIISCLGLLGLAAFTAERRKKEIGIRKALGQTAMQVSLLLTREFTTLILIALVIGLPLGYIISRNWLSTFAYKIDLHGGYFLLAGIIVLLIALLTVSSQAIRAARRNPIEALREE